MKFDFQKWSQTTSGNNRTDGTYQNMKVVPIRTFGNKRENSCFSNHPVAIPRLLL